MDRVNDATKQNKRKLQWQADEEKLKRMPATEKEKAYSIVQK